MFKSMVVSFAALLIAGAAWAQPASVPVKDFDVYVDTPTGFVFVKLPTGWKFVAAIDEEQMAHMPDTVLTSLLTRDADEMMLAQQGHEMAKP